MRLSHALVLPVALAAALTAGIPAHAAEGAGAVTDLLATVAVYDAPSLDSQLSGNCTYVRYAAGVANSGSVSYVLGGEATATGLYKGIEIVATGVRCSLVRWSGEVVSGTDWYPGAAAATATTASSWDASVLAICVEVYGILRHVPIGESDNLIETGKICR